MDIKKIRDNAINFGVKRLYNIDERPLRATHIVLTNRTFLNAIKRTQKANFYAKIA